MTQIFLPQTNHSTDTNVSQTPAYILYIFKSRHCNSYTTFTQSSFNIQIHVHMNHFPINQQIFLLFSNSKKRYYFLYNTALPCYLMALLSSHVIFPCKKLQKAGKK